MPFPEAAVLSRFFRLLLIAALVSASPLAGAGGALALSELQPLEREPVTPGQASGGLPGVDFDGVPDESQAAEPDAGTSEGETGQETIEAEILRDVSALPEPVRRLRESIVEAAASGEPERLRPLFGEGDNRTRLMSAEAEDDPVEALKAISGDPEGLEILAIILDVISTGFARVNAGQPDELYVWPYFAEKDIESLSAPETVELLRIVTAGDLVGMREYGGYNFFQIGLTPDGRWKFLTAGD